MKLSELLLDLGVACKAEDREVLFITDNSAKVAEGCIFICIEGKRFDGHTKAAEALANGAVAVVVQRIWVLMSRFLLKTQEPLMPA